MFIEFNEVDENGFELGTVVLNTEIIDFITHSMPMPDIDEETELVYEKISRLSLYTIFLKGNSEMYITSETYEEIRKKLLSVG